MSARWEKGGGGWKSFLEITGQRGGVGSSLEVPADLFSY